MKLLYSPSSPYSAKVRMAANYLGFAIEAIQVNPVDDPPELLGANPLGKIPTLIAEDGLAIYDSRSIMQFFHRESGCGLYPEPRSERNEAEVLEALCDGITDSLLAIVYERRFRPDELVYQPIIDRHWHKVLRGLAVLSSDLPKTDGTLHGGHFSVAALLGYLMLRFPGQWEEEFHCLPVWTRTLIECFPAFRELRPK